MNKALFVLQGGGPTAVINATLASLIATAGPLYDRIVGLPHSFEGKPDGRLLDLTEIRTAPGLDTLAATPGALLGSSRKKAEESDFARILSQMRAAGAATLVGIGGNGTMSALALFADYCEAQGLRIQVCGLPKTVDNDLPDFHVCPGYGSAARFVALAVRDFGYDFRAMSTFDDVTILETMGRETGWLAAASWLLKQDDEDPPHIVLVPERPVDEDQLLSEIHRQHARRGHVFVVVNEMLRTVAGDLLGATFQNGPTDSLGRHMYSLSLGTGNYLADLAWNRLGLQTRCLRPGNLGRALTACVAEPDRDLADRLGRYAVEALQGNGADGQIVTVDENLAFGLRPLRQSAGTRGLPDTFVGSEFGTIADEFSHYARPLIGDVKPLAPPLL